MPNKIKRILHLGGTGLACISLAFVASRIQTYWFDTDLTRIDANAWAIIGFLTVTYGSANLLLTFSWRKILQHLGTHISIVSAVKIYGVSQLVKYVPGNIFHLAGRQALGMAAGLSGSTLIKSTFWELTLLAISGATFALLLMPIELVHISTRTSLLLFCIVAAAVFLILYQRMSSRVSHAFLYHVVFLLISGTVFSVLAMLCASPETLSIGSFVLTTGAFIVAWLIGLATPGAPAGVGIRELVLLVLLNGLISESDLLVAVLISRLVTVLGDLLYFTFALAIPDR